jgi:hypothetical protein
VYSGDQRRIGRVSHLIYGSDVDTPEAVAVVRHGLTGTQTEVVPIGRVDLINATTQIVQLRDEVGVAADAETEPLCAAAGGPGRGQAARREALRRQSAKHSTTWSSAARSRPG